MNKRVFFIRRLQFLNFGYYSFGFGKSFEFEVKFSILFFLVNDLIEQCKDKKTIPIKKGFQGKIPEPP
jgi:hypothetical protein